MDNLVYSQAPTRPYYVNPRTTTDQATWISEAPEPGDRREDPWTGIVIANTWENGREGGMSFPDINQERRDIAIHGLVFAANSSFTFEEQNDIWDPYQCPTPPANDNRGRIYLTGAVHQRRRGYVHRSNHGGTGYYKSYYYDDRWDKLKNPNAGDPPFQDDLTSNNLLIWDLLGWQDVPRQPGDDPGSPY